MTEASVDTIPTVDEATLPGYTLSPLEIMDIGDLQEYFAANYLRVANVAAAAMTPKAGSSLLSIAMTDVRLGMFLYGSSGFDVAFSDTANLPKMLSIAARKKHPEVTVEKARGLIPASADDRARLFAALRKLAGYKKKAIQTKTKEGQDKESIGTKPSVSSEGVASESTTGDTSL